MILERFSRAIVRYAGDMDPRTLRKYMRGEFPEPFNRLLRDPEVVSALLADLESIEHQGAGEQAEVEA